MFRDFPTFSRISIFFLLALSLLLFFLLIFLFSLPLPCSAFHLSILSQFWLLNFLRLLRIGRYHTQTLSINHIRTNRNANVTYQNCSLLWIKRCNGHAVRADMITGMRNVSTCFVQEMKSLKLKDGRLVLTLDIPMLACMQYACYWRPWACVPLPYLHFPQSGSGTTPGKKWCERLETRIMFECVINWTICDRHFKRAGVLDLLADDSSDSRLKAAVFEIPKNLTHFRAWATVF